MKKKEFMEFNYKKTQKIILFPSSYFLNLIMLVEKYFLLSTNP